MNNLGEYINAWSGVIKGDEKDIEIKGYFYMALHLIRMLHFRLSVSEDQGMYAIASAIKAMTHALELIKIKIDSVNNFNKNKIFAEERKLN